MPAGCVLRPEEISLLARVLETHCSKHGIRTPEGKESVARSVLTHFGQDMTEAGLLEILDLEDNPVTIPSRSVSLHRRRRTLAGEAGIITTNEM